MRWSREHHVAFYLSRGSKVAQAMRRRKRNAIHVECSPSPGRGVAIQFVTAKTGYPLISRWLTEGFCLTCTCVQLDETLNMLYDHFRSMRCSPQEYAVFQSEEPFSHTHPALHDHLTRDFWDNGKPRNRSRLNVWCDDVGWKGFVRDYNTRLLLWGSGESLAALLNVLDTRIASGDRSLWRRDRYYHGDSK